MEKDLVPKDVARKGDKEKAREVGLKHLQKFLGLTEEESKSLVELITAPTPNDWIKTRPARGGIQVEYLPGFRFIEKLNSCFGFLWSHRVVDAFERDGHIVTTNQVVIQIPGRTISKEYPDGTKELIRFDGLEVVKTQFGGSDVKKYSRDTGDKRKGDIIDLADDYKASATDGMKKCSTELGMFLDVYGQRETQEGGPSRQQLEVLYMRGKNAGMDEIETDQWVEEQLGKSIKECDQLDIMGLIPKLIDLAKEKKGV